MLHEILHCWRVSVIFCLCTWFFHLQSHHAIYQFIWMQNSWYRLFRDSALLHGILQCCRITGFFFVSTLILSYETNYYLEKKMTELILAPSGPSHPPPREASAKSLTNFSKLPHEALTQLAITKKLPPHPRCPHSKCLYWLYLSHFSRDLAKIFNDCFLGGKDQVCRQNIDPCSTAVFLWLKIKN